MILTRRAFVGGGTLAALSTRARASAGTVMHIFGYGQSLELGLDGVYPVSTTQPYDNWMIGKSTRAAVNNAHDPISTTWVPLGNPAGAVYPFTPMIATSQNLQGDPAGETSAIGAVNYLRRQWLARGGDPTVRFVVTNCGIGGKTIAQLSKGASPEIFNRLRDAANQVKATATALGMNYQVGAVIYTQAEADVAQFTSYAHYLARLQQLQRDVQTDIVQTIAGQSNILPWFAHQPATLVPNRTTAVDQAILDWATTPGSNYYLAGPVYPYPDHGVHLTANSYRWYGNMVGKAMEAVMLDGSAPRPLYMTAATGAGTTIQLQFNVPTAPLIIGDSYSRYTSTVYPNLGLLVSDDAGPVPIQNAAISASDQVTLILGRSLSTNPVVQSGYNLIDNVEWGTNLCDSDATQAQAPYTYTPGVQQPGESIATWNGAPLIDQPYPLNNYLALATLPITV